jgi:hypothetical protein
MKKKTKAALNIIISSFVIIVIQILFFRYKIQPERNGYYFFYPVVTYFIGMFLGAMWVSYRDKGL